MTVVIQELVVRVVVEPSGLAQPTSMTEAERRTLVAAAVEETLKVLRREQER